MTNAEKIRQMDDVQLARFLWIWKINSISAFLADGGYGSMNAVDIGSWVDEDAEDTFVCTETYVGDDYIFDQDFNNKADRKTENCSEKPNNCEECKHWSDTENGCADRHGCRATTEDCSTVKPQNYCDDCLYCDTCDSKEFFYACTSKATISKMEQVDKDINVRSKTEPQTEPQTEKVWNAGYKTGYDKGYKDAQKVKDSQDLVKDLVDDEFNPYDEECMRCKHLKLKCEFVPSYCKYELRDEPQTERIKTPDYCDICNHKGCGNCIANNLDDYCVPSGYEPITQMKTQNSNLSFEKADEPNKIIEAYSHGFKDGAEAVKAMPQTFVADGIVFAKMDEPQTCSVNGRPYDCGNCEYHKCTADEPQRDYEKYLDKIRSHDPHKDWFEDEPKTERKDQ